jgi:hypothetical protein
VGRRRSVLSRRLVHVAARGLDEELERGSQQALLSNRGVGRRRFVVIRLVHVAARLDEEL